MLALGTPAWEIVLRSFLVYLGTFVGMRVMGKRELGQMTLLDLVIILLIANAVQNAMVGPDTSLLGGLLAAFVLLATNRIFATLQLRGEWWGRLLEGTPTVLIEHGQFISANLRREGLDHAEVEMAIREHGVASVDEVQLAVLETDGSISIVPNDAKVTRTRRRVRQVRH
jgi:uncharacterized membrane protein YcaP (DUF421 family)